MPTWRAATWRRSWPARETRWKSRPHSTSRIGSRMRVGIDGGRANNILRIGHAHSPPPTLAALRETVEARRPLIYIYPRHSEWRRLERRIPLRPHARYL